ncbi:hypothetical protein IT6_03485 [Methylacidiphilum caldifontis]|uniref:hypothetical protein n=1 Tax=Methylacidiphilum caldifontis TaxID=2795386 RepID=UPI001A8ECFAE|nr:hypothetical protein [Methylacidiphilum caldifontis]QSR89354.1 hypothetical protein IT6_03485 [Methylacidiphilum caldifontis]
MSRAGHAPFRVDNGSTSIAYPHAEHLLATGEEPIRHKHQAAVPFGLVFQLSPELEKAHVGNGLGQMAVSASPTRIQYLDGGGV